MEDLKMNLIPKYLKEIITIFSVILIPVFGQAQFVVEFDRSTDTSACLGHDKAGDFTIIIRETQTDGFSLASENYIFISAPPGFEFENDNNNRAVNISDSSFDISSLSITELNSTQLRFFVTTRTLEEGETAVLDTIIISGLEVRKTSNSAHTLCCH